MNRIFYYNITYRCNLNCVFCFSNSTRSNGKYMDADTIIGSLYDLNPDDKDLIVINGGEPSIHPDFYKIMLDLQTRYKCEIAIYSNGSIIDASKLHENKKTFFVIPIHGTESQHDAISQNSGSFQHSLSNINLLNEIGYRYRLKFIINDMMINKDFNIRCFVEEHHLSPEEIIIARLNRTAKSKKNHVIIPSDDLAIPYIQKQINQLRCSYKLKALDIPPCKLMIYPVVENNVTVPTFFFNDANNIMNIRPYFKEIILGSKCEECKNNAICKIMQHSYLTLSIYNDIIKLERE